MGEKDFVGSVTMAEMPIKACTRLRGMRKDFDGVTMAEMRLWLQYDDGGDANKK